MSLRSGMANAPWHAEKETSGFIGTWPVLLAFSNHYLRFDYNTLYNDGFCSCLMKV